VIVSRQNIRRGVLGVLAAAVLVGVSMAIVMLPFAKADPDPCSASNLTATIAKVNNDTSQYLVGHADANQALADVAKQSSFSALNAFNSYFDEHSAEKTDLHDIQQPLRDLSDRCAFQVSPGEVLGALSDL
jgi:hemophore-related protein